MASVAITAGVNALTKLLGGLLAGHDARVTAAKNENAALNQLVPIIATNIQNLFAALNSGAISKDQGLQYLTQIEAAYWSNIKQYQQASTGCVSNGGSGNNEPSGSHTQCNKSCTAGCCVGCNNIHGWIVNATQVIEAGGGTATFHSIPGCSACNGGAGYGFNPTQDFTLTYTAPVAETAITSTIDQLTGTTVLNNVDGSVNSVISNPTTVLLLGGAFLLVYLLAER